MQVCVNMSKAVYVQVYLDLENKKYIDEELEAMAGDVYIEAIRRANDYPLEGPAIKMETINTTFLEVVRD